MPVTIGGRMKVRSLPVLLVWFGLTISPVLAADIAEKAAAGAAQAWLGQIDAGNYGKSWKDLFEEQLKTYTDAKRRLLLPPTPQHTKQNTEWYRFGNQYVVAQKLTQNS